MKNASPLLKPNCLKKVRKTAIIEPRKHADEKSEGFISFKN